ncbi:MAG: MCP four helix bundle domain-containing protein [Thermonemataceae bacterium]
MSLFSNSNFKNRSEITVAFAIIIVVILVVGLIGTGGINHIAGDVKAMYYDRLYPAVEMAKITEKLYENRLNVEEHLVTLNKGKMQVIEREIFRNHQVIDSLIEKYAGTALVDNEKVSLINYQREVFAYTKIENDILTLSRNGQKTQALKMFSSEGFEEFKRMMEPVHDITDRQIVIGKELYNDSMRNATQVRIALYVAMIIVVLIGAILGTVIAFRYLHQ